MHNTPETYAVVYQQTDGSPNSTWFDRVWIHGGRSERDDLSYNGCLDYDRTAWQLPDSTVNGGIGVISVDPSPTKRWAIQAWWYAPPITVTSRNDSTGGTRYLLALYDGRLGIDQALDYDIDSRRFVGVIEAFRDKYVQMGRRCSYLIVEENGAQIFIKQHKYVKVWCREHSIVLPEHFTDGRKKLDPLYGVRGLEQHYRFGRYRFPFATPSDREMVKPLCDQLKGWPDGTDYDDQVMANWIFEYKLRDLWRPPTVTEREWRPTWLTKQR